MRSSIVSVVLVLWFGGLFAAETRKVVCHESDDYLVVERENEEAGNDFLVKYKRPDSESECKYQVEEGDFEIKNEWAEYFMALHRDLLILDSGTGPDPRDFIIWDLGK